MRRVGDRAARRVDVRVIAATNQPLATKLRSAEFREDLYYRLSGLVIELPELRERLDDIPLLAEALLVGCARAAGVRAKGFTPAALVRLATHAWPQTPDGTDPRQPRSLASIGARFLPASRSMASSPPRAGSVKADDPAGRGPSERQSRARQP